MKAELTLLHENRELRRRLRQLEELLSKTTKTEESLKAERQFISALLDTLDALVVVLDRGGRILRFNRACEVATGYTFAEVKNKPFWDIFLTPEEIDEVKAGFRKLCSGRGPKTHENYWIDKEGHLRRIAWSNTALFQDRQIQFVIGTGIDITDREQAEKHIARLASFPQLNPDPVLEIDLSGRIIFYNAALLKTLEGLDLPGRVEAFLPWDPTEIQKKAKELGNDHFQCEVEIGNSIFEEQISFPSGLNTMRIYAWDVTNRKRADEELRRQAELLDLSHDAIIVRDMDNCIVFWNIGAEETYGWRKAEVQGEKSHELLSTEFPQPQQELEVELFQKGQWQGELSQTRQDGRRIVVASRWGVQRDKEGKPIAILEINRDITGQKQAEAGRSRLAAILESTSDLVGTCDRDGRVLYLNQAGRKMLGIGLDDDLSRLTVAELQPEWVHKFIGEHSVAEAIAPEIWSGETTFVSRRGPQIPVSQVVIVHKNATGEVEFFSTVARDITASKRAEEDLRESQQKLRLLTSQLLSIQEKERWRISRELHDELGQALTVLKIMLMAIEDKLTLNQHPLKANCELMLSYIDRVIENVRRLSWDLSPSILEDLGLSSALRHLVEETCNIHNLQSSVQMDKIDHLFSQEDQINIYRIFQESLTNVVKHARASQVSAKISREKGQVSFMIQDDGRGFNMKRVMSGKSAKRSLGLTAINERVLMAQGLLQIASRRGKGTTISFAIPTINRTGVTR